jgi:Na+-driven multidrug efflux pump
MQNLNTAKKDSKIYEKSSFDREKAEKFLSQGFFLLVLFTVLLTAAVGLFLDPILKVTGASDQTLPYAHIYMAIYLSGTFFVMINVGLTPFLNVQGKARQTMISAVIGALLK